MNKDRSSELKFLPVTDSMLKKAQAEEFAYAREYNRQHSERRRKFEPLYPVLWRDEVLMPLRRRGPNTGKNQKAY